MRLLILLSLLEFVVSAPRTIRQASVALTNNAPAPEAAPEHFSKHALFIPRGMEPEGFDPSKPIQGAFFMSNDNEPFNQPTLTRLPSPVLTNRALAPLPSPGRAPDAAETAKVPAQGPVSFGGHLNPAPHHAPLPVAPHLAPLEAVPGGSPLTPAAIALAPSIEQLVTTTENAPTLPTVEQNPVPPVALQSLPPVNPNLAPVDKSVDLDGDGRLSLSEVQYAAFVHHGLSGTVVQGMFNEVDHNKDGYLDSAEFNDIRTLVLAKAENAALRYMQSVDTDKNKMLSLEEAQAYILKEHGIGSRDVERVWRLVVPDTSVEMDALQFSKLRRRIRGMTIRLARQIMKIADVNGDGHISLDEAQAIAFEQEGIGAGDVAQMFASVDDNNDGELNAPEFADFERIVRARAVETSKKALRVVDTDASNTLTMDEARRIAFEHYGFDENILTPFFDQADENEDGHLDAVEFAGFRTVIRSKAVRNAIAVLKQIDLDGDGLVSLPEAEEKTRKEDDMETHETATLFNIADQNKSGKLDKVELADFIRLVRLSAIRFATDHFKEFDANRDRLVTVDELAQLIQNKYHVPFEVTKEFFEKVDVDASGDLIPAEIVDFRHEIRKYVAQHPGLTPPEQDSEDVTSFPTLLPSTRRKVTFRKHTTIIPQTNDIEELLGDGSAFEMRTQPEQSPAAVPQEDIVDVPSTRVPQVWKKSRLSTSSFTITAATSSVAPEESTLSTSTHPPFRNRNSARTSTAAVDPSETTDRSDLERSITSRRPFAFISRKSTTTTTESTANDEITTSAYRATPKLHRIARTTTTSKPTTESPQVTTMEDVEYEIVEVEVDEDGNEIVGDKGESTEEAENVKAKHSKSLKESRNVQQEQIWTAKPSQRSQTALDERQRKKLVAEQKRKMNLPASTEVEYVDADTTKRPDDGDGEDLYDDKVEH
ncbi:hypothetical protein Q1695_014969 [Nippostrongylus brasiliensis]|nr:hypothetical protein Q1695_014969 [Nippostrongylus brasiliensis]